MLEQQQRQRAACLGELCWVGDRGTAPSQHPQARAGSLARQHVMGSQAKGHRLQPRAKCQISVVAGGKDFLSIQVGAAAIQINTKTVPEEVFHPIILYFFF